MTHETARRSIFRLWLRAFAGIVAVLFLPSTVRSGELSLEQVLSGAPFSRPPNIGEGEDERVPVAAFTTEDGVYELDTKQKVVRVWPRSLRKGELKECRLNGVDSSKAGTRFANPVSFCKKPGEKVIAVVDAIRTVEGLGRYSRVAFFSFEETLTDGVLSAVSFTYEGEIRNEVLEHASDVAFFPTSDKVAVSISRHSSGPSMGDEGAVQFYEIPSSADTPVTDPVNSFLCVRTKNVYEGSLSNTGAEPYNVPITSVCVDSDEARIWTGSESLSAVVRYDPVVGDVYDETITIQVWEWDMNDGPQWDPESISYFDAATADFVMGALGVTNLTSATETDLYSPTAPPGFNPGDLGMAGSTNNLLSAPGSIQMWASPNGNLLVAADTDNDRVVAFDSMGNARFTFNPSDRQASKFSRPRGAWVSEDGTELVVADTGNGRVEVFQLTEADSALDKTIGVATETPFFWETDTGWFTNWIVATTASSEARTYTISVESDPAGCVAIEQETVTLPAGATRVPFAIRPLDGAENGTTCTLSITGWETNAVFVISNVPPSVRTGPTTATGEEVDNGSYLYIDEGSVMDVSETLIPMDENPGLLLARPGVGGAIHFHAKAFDVMADDLTYRWDIIGTRNTLLDPVYRTVPYYQTVPYYYYVDTNNVPPKTKIFTLEEAAEFKTDRAGNKLYIEGNVTNVLSYYSCKEGVPPTLKTITFTPEEAADFPEDDDGHKLYIEVRQSQQAPNEQLFITNVLSYAEATNALIQNVQLDWAAFLFDDEQGADFVCSTATLDGPDAEFSALEEGVTYFAILTVTDKDGGVWRSLTSPDESYVCFVAGGDEPLPVEGALYAAVFTDISATNVSFDVSWTGVPVAGDTVTLESATNLVSGPWTAFGSPIDVGTPAAGGENPVKVNVTPIDTDDVHFYRVVQP